MLRVMMHATTMFVDARLALQRATSWWRHQMETFSALLAICAGNSPVPGEFPAQRPVTRSFDVFFDLRPNKRLSKQSWGWWFETSSCPLWHNCNVPRTPLSQATYEFMWFECVYITLSDNNDFRLREEVEEVLGARRDVDYEDLSSLNYCDNVIKETLRMYPPAAVTFREVNRDGFTLEGYPIPKGSNLMVRST